MISNGDAFIYVAQIKNAIYVQLLWRMPLDNQSTTSVRQKCWGTPGEGGGGTPCNGLYREAPPERGILFRLEVYNSRDFTS